MFICFCIYTYSIFVRFEFRFSLYISFVSFTSHHKKTWRHQCETLLYQLRLKIYLFSQNNFYNIVAPIMVFNFRLPILVLILLICAYCNQKQRFILCVNSSLLLLLLSVIKRLYLKFFNVIHLSSSITISSEHLFLFCFHIVC